MNSLETFFTLANIFTEDIPSPDAIGDLADATMLAGVGIAGPWGGNRHQDGRSFHRDTANVAHIGDENKMPFDKHTHDLQGGHYRSPWCCKSPHQSRRDRYRRRGCPVE